ncbi:MAG: hypothetical protein MJ252_29880 [archaeon]|nr:hypothetical protein [archaeon]
MSSRFALRRELEEEEEETLTKPLTRGTFGKSQKESEEAHQKEEEEKLKKENSINPQSEELKTEIKNAIGDETDSKRKVAKVSEFFKTKLRSTSFLNSIDSSFFEITSELKTPLKDISPEKSKLKFDVEEGSSSSVALNVLKKYKCQPSEICIQFFADQTYFGCGIFKKWTTQEEATLRDSTPALFGTLLNQGYINPPNCDSKMSYIGNKLSTSDGYLIRGELLHINLDPLPQDIPCFRPYFMFNSMPSFSENKNNFDEAGAASWIVKCRKICCGETEDFSDAKQFASAFYSKMRSQHLSSNVCQKALKILLFSTHYKVSNTGNKEGVVNDIIEDSQKSTPGYLKQAEENYKKTVTETVKRWVLLAKEKGVKYFIGGAIGCGAFANKAEDVSKIMAEVFHKYGGDMTYVYSVYKRNSDANLKCFEKAFKEYKDEDDSEVFDRNLEDEEDDRDL